jgi:hypothetical protein
VDKLDENILFFALCVAHTHRCLRSRDSNQRTLLHALVVTASADLCTVAIDFNATCADATDNAGNTPYHLASAHGRSDILRLLCGQRLFPPSHHRLFAPPSFTFPGKGCRERNDEGWSPIHLATEAHNSSHHRSCLEVLSEFGDANSETRVREGEVTAGLPRTWYSLPVTL